MPLSPTKPLAFSYFQIDVPQDINFSNSLVKASAFGNNWLAYPVSNQAEFEAIIKAKAQKLYNEKLSEKDLAYIRQIIKSDIEVNGSPVNTTDLKMTRRLYKVFQIDKWRYNIISVAPVGNYTSNVVSEKYWYIPDQKQYLYTKTNRLPSKDVVDISSYQEMTKKFYSFWAPVNEGTLADPHAMALGHVMWVTNINEQPYIKYNMISKSVPVDIDLLSHGFTNDGYSSAREAKGVISDRMNQGKQVFLRDKTVAGMHGTEFCAFEPEDEVGSAAFFWCGWITKGQKENLMQPAIELHMRYRTTQESTAIAAWQQLINSLKIRTHK